MSKARKRRSQGQVIIPDVLIDQGNTSDKSRKWIYMGGISIGAALAIGPIAGVTHVNAADYSGDLLLGLDGYGADNALIPIDEWQLPVQDTGGEGSVGAGVKDDDDKDDGSVNDKDDKGVDDKDDKDDDDKDDKDDDDSDKGKAGDVNVVLDVVERNVGGQTGTNLQGGTAGGNTGGQGSTTTTTHLSSQHADIIANVIGGGMASKDINGMTEAELLASARAGGLSEGAVAGIKNILSGGALFQPLPGEVIGGGSAPMQQPAESLGGVGGVGGQALQTSPDITMTSPQPVEAMVGGSITPAQQSIEGGVGGVSGAAPTALPRAGGMPLPAEALLGLGTLIAGAGAMLRRSFRL